MVERAKGFDAVRSAEVTLERLADGRQRLQAEAARLDAIRDAAAIPAECGPEMVSAPARGAFRVFRQMRIERGWRRNDGWAGRSTLAAADVFDRMIERARQSHMRKAPDAPFIAPLSPAQVTMGRFYRDLVERHEAGGMRCASLEAGRGGGGSGEFIDAFVAEGRAIDALRRRIGSGTAMVLRRVRPSVKGTRAAILDRVLVDMVCLQDRDLSQVLAAHGWALKGPMRESLREALARTLDRMMGYDLFRDQNVG